MCVDIYLIFIRLLKIHFGFDFRYDCFIWIILWKFLMCVTGSESPVVVDLFESMDPAFQRVSLSNLLLFFLTCEYTIFIQIFISFHIKQMYEFFNFCFIYFQGDYVLINGWNLIQADETVVFNIDVRLPISSVTLVFYNSYHVSV